MAYTNAPTVSVYQTKTIPLENAWQTRDYQNSNDVINQNIVWDIIKNSTTGEDYFEAIKRNGFNATTLSVLPGSTIYGMYYWDFIGYLVVVGSFGMKFYNTSGTQIVSTGTTFNDKHIGFTQFLYENGTVTLIITDGSNIYEVTTAGVVTAIVDPDRPVAHLPYPVVLDGYLFLGTSSGNIQNSNLNDPKLWTAGDFIAVESYPDTLAAIARSGQYVVAFGATSIQYFYDAANPTGTPLAAQTVALQIGFQGGLVNHKDDLIFIGAGANTKPTIYNMSGLKATPLVDSSLIRTLERAFNLLSANFLREGNIINVNGHSLYTWVDRDSDNSAALRYTYAVDLDSGLFTQTTGRFSTAVFPDAVHLPIRTSATCYFNGEFITLFAPFNSNYSDGSKVYNFSSTLTQDTGLPLDVKFQTKLTNFGNKRTKFCSRVLFDCDRAVSSTQMQVQYRTEDTFLLQGANFTVDLASPYPVVWGLTQFRTIQMIIIYSGDQNMRWRGVEVDYLQGDF